MRRPDLPAPDPVGAAARCLSSTQRRNWAEWADRQAHLWRDRYDGDARMALVYEAIAWTMRLAEAEEVQALEPYAADWAHAEAAGKQAYEIEHLSGRDPDIGPNRVESG